jgi:hypothetical protein
MILQGGSVFEIWQNTVGWASPTILKDQSKIAHQFQGIGGHSPPYIERLTHPGRAIALTELAIPAIVCRIPYRADQKPL